MKIIQTILQTNGKKYLINRTEEMTWIQEVENNNENNTGYMTPKFGRSLTEINNEDNNTECMTPKFGRSLAEINDQELNQISQKDESIEKLDEGYKNFSSLETIESIYLPTEEGLTLFSEVNLDMNSKDIDCNNNIFPKYVKEQVKKVSDSDLLVINSLQTQWNNLKESNKKNKIKKINPAKLAEEIYDFLSDKGDPIKYLIKNNYKTKNMTIALNAIDRAEEVLSQKIYPVRQKQLNDLIKSHFKNLDIKTFKNNEQGNNNEKQIEQQQILTRIDCNKQK